MPGNTSNTNAVKDASAILEVWKANPDFTMGKLTRKQFETALIDLQSANAEVENTRTALTGLMGGRNDKGVLLKQLVTRARSGLRAQYGPDSTQYQQGGGTRVSERKSGKTNKSQDGNGNGDGNVQPAA